MTQPSDPHDSSDDWISYEQFADERFNKHSQMLEQLELGPGPGPPIFDFPAPPDFFPPPPPIPGNVEECETFSSHFDHCDISKESTSSPDPYLHLMSVIVAVFCLIILASCITIFLVWRRRRSKSHASDLHSYCVSGRGGVAGSEGQFYDDLYLSGHLGPAPHRNLNQYSRHNTFYNRHQVDLASFLLQTSPEGQPIYEEIPQGQLLTSSDHSSDHYVDTTSGYHTLPLDNEYSESETGLFLVPVNSHNNPLILNKDFQVPGGKTNKKFFTFHKKSLETNKNPKSRNEHDVVNSNFLNQFETLDNKVPTKQQQPKKTKCGKSFVHSKTLDMNNQNHYNFQNINANQHPRAVYRATYQPTTLNTRLGRPGLNGVSRGTPILQHSARTQPSTLSRKNSSTIQRQNQDNFLPRTAWTDTSGSDDWLDVANDNKNDKSGGGTTQQNVPSTMGNYSHYERPVCPSPPDLISNKCRTTSASPSNISTSDVTVSPSSSESYPECRF